MFQLRPAVFVAFLAVILSAPYAQSQNTVEQVLENYVKQGYSVDHDLNKNEILIAKHNADALQKLIGKVEPLNTRRNPILKSPAVKKAKILEWQIASDLLDAYATKMEKTKANWQPPLNRVYKNFELGGMYLIPEIEVAQVLSEKQIHAYVRVGGRRLDQRVCVVLEKAKAMYDDQKLDSSNSFFACTEMVSYTTTTGAKATIPKIIEVSDTRLTKFVGSKVSKEDLTAVEVPPDYTSMARVWKSADGAFSREGYCEAATTQNVVINVKGKKIQVELNKLSYVDRLYAGAFLRAKKAINGPYVDVGEWSKLASFRGPNGLGGSGYGGY